MDQKLTETLQEGKKNMNQAEESGAELTIEQLEAVTGGMRYVTRPDKADKDGTGG
jgi:hypothetical protein